MANELIVTPRRLDQPIVGDKLQIQGSHVRTGTDNRVDAGNSDSYTVTAGVQYLQLTADESVYYRISPSGASAEEGKDVLLPAGDSHEVYAIHDGNAVRPIAPGDQVKCVLKT